MPTAVVLLPSTTYRAGDFVRAAEGLGIDLIVVSEQPPPFDMGDRGGYGRPSSPRPTTGYSG